nr:argonaute/Dicer protein, PAZ [Tanacetum cinerariifolium]
KVVEVRWRDGEGADGGNMMGRIDSWWCCGEVTGVIVVTVRDGESGGVAGVVVTCVAVAVCTWWWEGCRCEDDGGDVVMVAGMVALAVDGGGDGGWRWKLRSGDGARQREFKVSVKFAATKDNDHLRQFLSSRQHDNPQETIQAFDIVLREAASSNEYVTILHT